MSKYQWRNHLNRTIRGHRLRLYARFMASPPRFQKHCLGRANCLWPDPEGQDFKTELKTWKWNIWVGGIFLWFPRNDFGIARNSKIKNQRTYRQSAAMTGFINYEKNPNIWEWERDWNFMFWCTLESLFLGKWRSGILHLPKRIPFVGIQFQMFYLSIQIGTIIPCFVGEQILRYLLDVRNRFAVVNAPFSKVLER